MTAAPLSHRHVWQQGRPGAPTFLLLHGTGGDERDLLPLAQRLDPDANVLSPRGNVLEEGMPRFFRRHAPGVLDLDDLRRRARELADFVRAASREYGFALADVTAVGYSNGANVAVGVLFEEPEPIARAVLLRAMLAYRPARPPQLAGRRVLLAAGERDPYSRRESTEPLAEILRAAGATVDVAYAPAGHELTPFDVEAARKWLASAPR